MLASQWNATRFAQKPLAQPSYRFAHVPPARSDLRYSCLQYVDSREAFHACMAEMLLLCKEATRRRRNQLLAAAGRREANEAADAANAAAFDAAAAAAITASKPLSLEYLADRIDVDDPIFGFLVRTAEPDPDHPDGGTTTATSWQRGMLQGFLTATTFTTYNKTFAWDSLHPSAFLYDEEHRHHGGSSGDEKTGSGDGGGCKRVRDEDGTLAAEMQATVRRGDIWNEGIVWPRIAEISLLGGLRCGRTLVSLAIEHLECMKASGRCNYDYVVLQATDNSISFYESMGFVRVGAIVTDDANKNESGATALSSSSNSTGRRRSSGNSSSSDGSAAVVAEPVPDDSPEKPNAVAQSLDVVCSPTVLYSVSKPGETPHDVARKCTVDVWDIVFLNQDRYPDITPRSRLLAGTVLQVPAPPNPTSATTADKPRADIQWYTAKENDTPRMIAKMFNVNCLELVDANKHRLEGLLSNSRLKEGTRVQVSDFDSVPDALARPYAHWSFPDDQFEEPEPSYMMARRLVRRRGSSTHKHRHVEASLAIPITTYEPPNLLLEPPPMSPDPTPAAVASTLNRSAPRHVGRGKGFGTGVPPPPTPPKRAPSPYLLFAAEQREKLRDELRGMRAADLAKHLSAQWNALSAAERSKYEKTSSSLREDYHRRKIDYEEALEAYRQTYPVAASLSAQTSSSSSADESSSAATPVRASSAQRSSSSKTSGRRSSSTSGCSLSSSLFNKVVKLKPGSITEGSEYTYWYVLTFIPDLRWCHLAPMIPVGTFGPDKPKSQGRLKYKLVDESLGQEVDISSSFCIPVKSRSMKRTLDADKEEWDVIDDGTAEDDGMGESDAAPKASRRRPRVGMPSSSSVPQHVSGRDAGASSSHDLPPLTALWKRRPVSVRIILGMTKCGRPATAQDLGMAPQLPRVESTVGQRKRGRPSITFALDDASTLSQDDSEYEEPPRKKRGRPKGSKNKALPSAAAAMAPSHSPGRRSNARSVTVEDAAKPNSTSTPQRGCGCPPNPHSSVHPSATSTNVPIVIGSRARSLPPFREGIATRQSPSPRRERSADPRRSSRSPPQNPEQRPKSDFHSQDQSTHVVPVKRGRGRPKGSKNRQREDLLPPPPSPDVASRRSSRRIATTQEAPAPGAVAPTNRSPPSTPSSIRSRSEPPVCSRATPGRAAALMSLGVLHSPLVRVRGIRVAPVAPGEGLFSPKPSAPTVRQSTPRQARTPRRSSTPGQHQRKVDKTQRSPPIPRRTLPPSQPQQPFDAITKQSSAVPRRAQPSPQQIGLSVNELSRTSPALRPSSTPSRQQQSDQTGSAPPSNPRHALTPSRLHRNDAISGTSPAASRRSLTPLREKAVDKSPHTSPAGRLTTSVSKALSPEAVKATPKSATRTSRSTNFNYLSQQRDENGKFIKRSDSVSRSKSGRKEARPPSSVPPVRAEVAPLSENRLTRGNSHSNRGRSRTPKSRQDDDDSAGSTFTAGRRPVRRRDSKSAKTQESQSPTMAMEKDVEWDAEESSGSAGSSGRRRHVNSPLVRRSIRNRKGRHVSHRNEVHESSSPSLRSAAIANRKRTRSSPEGPSSPGSPRTVHQAHAGTGKVSRELLSLLPYYPPRKRRHLGSSGSRRGMLQN